jgi:hypothetical protein
MRKSEPPSSLRSPLLQVGKDSHDNWIVRDPEGMRGGIFVDRVEALKYAMFETGHRPQAVIMVPGLLELEISSTPPRSARAETPRGASRLARVA